MKLPDQSRNLCKRLVIGGALACWLGRWNRSLLEVNQIVYANERRCYGLKIRIDWNERLKLAAVSAVKLVPHDAQPIEGMLHGNDVDVLEPAPHPTHSSWPE